MLKATDDNQQHPQHKPVAHPSTGRIALIIVILAALLAGWGIYSRLHQDHNLKSDTNKEAVPVVSVIKASNGNAVQGDVILPGNLRAWHEASIYARVGGYLKTWNKDIGDTVKAGDVLAEIDTPELDSQLRQAEADAKLSAANGKLANATAKRWRDLRKLEAVTQQETDEKIADASAKAAAEQSALANRDRLLDLKAFKQLTAPFDGIVTARNTDVGALINAGSGNDPQELFHVATVDKLRVYVNVPENYRAIISPELVAELSFSEHPDQKYPAKFLSTANAFDPATRTVLVQFELENPDGAFYPGSYTEVHLKNDTIKAQGLRLPVNVFIFKASGLQIGVVGADNKVSIRTVKVGRDFGSELEIIDGVAAGEQVIINPADSLINGQEVRIAPPAKQDAGEQQQRAKDAPKKEDSKEDKKNKDQNPDNNAGPKDGK